MTPDELMRQAHLQDDVERLERQVALLEQSEARLEGDVQRLVAAARTSDMSMSEGTGDSREQAIAAGKYAFQSSGKWDDRYFLHAFELGLDAAHRAGHIHYTEEQGELELLRACVREAHFQLGRMQHRNTYAQWAYDTLARGLGYVFDGERWVHHLTGEALGDGEEGPDTRDDEPTGGRP